MTRIASLHEGTHLARYLVKSTTVPYLQKLCKKHGVACEGTKIQLIQRLESSLESSEILEEIRPEESLKWYSKLFIKALLDGATNKRSIFGHPVIMAVLNRISDDTRIRYGKEVFVDDFMRWNRNALVNKGIVSLKRTGRDWTYSLLPEFAVHLGPCVMDISADRAVELFLESQDYKFMIGYSFRPTGSHIFSDSRHDQYDTIVQVAFRNSYLSMICVLVEADLFRRRPFWKDLRIIP